MRWRCVRTTGRARPLRAAQAQAAPLDHVEFLELLVEDELTRRADRLYARRLKQAGIVQPKGLSDFDWAFNPKVPKARLVALATAQFVRTRGGVLLIGPPGLGKTHLATAIAVGAILRIAVSAIRADVRERTTTHHMNPCRRWRLRRY